MYGFRITCCTLIFMSFIGNLYNRESLLCINNCVEHVNEATYGKALASYTPVVNTCRMTNGSKANKIPKNRNITSLEEPKLSKVPENSGGSRVSQNKL